MRSASRNALGLALGSALRVGLGGGATSAPAFTFVMRTTGASETVTLPMTGSVNTVIDWGDGSPPETVTTDSITHVYATADDYTIAITGSCDVFAFDNAGDKLKLIELLAWGTDFTFSDLDFFGCSNLVTASDLGASGATPTYLSNAFRSCTGLTSLDLTGFDTSSCTDMNSMFAGCSSLTSLDLTSFDTSSCASMNSMFLVCSSLTSLDLTSFDTSSCTDMNSMFVFCSSLTSDPGIVGFNVESLTTAASMCFIANSMLSTAEYNAILVAWEAQAVQNNVNVHFGDATYSGAGATARAALIADGWTVSDGGEA